MLLIAWKKTILEIIIFKKKFKTSHLYTYTTNPVIQKSKKYIKHQKITSKWRAL